MSAAAEVRSFRIPTEGGSSAVFEPHHEPDRDLQAGTGTSLPELSCPDRFTTAEELAEAVTPSPVSCDTFIVTIDAVGSTVEGVVYLEWDRGSIPNQEP